MLTRILTLALCAIPTLAATACGTDVVDPEASETTSDELRTLAAAEIVGTIAYGETKSGIAYDETSTYRALSFHGTAGDDITVDVAAASADATMWLLADTFRTLRSNDNATSSTHDARIKQHLTKTGTYYVAFREKNYEDTAFTVTLTRAGAPPAPPPPPPPAPQTNDPFDDASCQGELLVNPASLFAPGGVLRQLGPSIAQWQSRECNAVTGCTPWAAVGSGFAGVQYAGTAQLSVHNNAIQADFLGTVRGSEQITAAQCAVSNGNVACDARNYLGANNFIAVSGTLRQHCIRVTGSNQTRNPLNGQLDGHEYRLAMLARF